MRVKYSTVSREPSSIFHMKRAISEFSFSMSAIGRTKAITKASDYPPSSEWL